MASNPIEEPRKGRIPSVAESSTPVQEPAMDGGTDPDVIIKPGLPVYQTEEDEPSAAGEKG